MTCSTASAAAGLRLRPEVEREALEHPAPGGQAAERGSVSGMEPDGDPASVAFLAGSRSTVRARGLEGVIELDFAAPTKLRIDAP
jgi:hypothetical protein